MPSISNKDDTSNFDEKFEKLEVQESIISPDKLKIIKEHSEDFRSF